MFSRMLAHTSRTALALGGIACALALASCEDEHDHGDECEMEEPDHSHDTCGLQENCIDTEDLEEGLRVESEDGAFFVEVIEHAPLAIEDNEIIVAIENADGDPVTDAELDVDAFSVDCMHGGPNPAATVTADADGRYLLAPVHLHGGPWDTVIAIDAGGETDTVRLHFCVPGAEHGDAGTAGRADEPHCD